MSALTHLECAHCGKTASPEKLRNLCECGGPFLCRYDLLRLQRDWPRESLRQAPKSLWRYTPVLPVREHGNRIELGEGWTPLLPATRLRELLGLENLFIKDESPNPTGSFKARGLCLAMSRARELGVRKVAIPSAGNAASAAAAYAAAAGVECHVFMPCDVPQLFVAECEALGAHVHLVDGLITDCAKELAVAKEREGYFELATLTEPYRLEGKKTMGYELVEQFGWTLPDVIIYPTGGGTGLIGMWKAFDELTKLGWLQDAPAGRQKPRMVSVQSTGCAPIVRAFEQGLSHAPVWQAAQTIAAGLRVPRALGDFLMLRVLRESRGTAVAVSDEEILHWMRTASAATGIFLCPEGAAACAAAAYLSHTGWIQPKERVVIFNTGSGLKYAELIH